MKAKVILVLLLVVTSVNAQFFNSPKETVEIGLFVDPAASFKENGIDVGIEAGYRGVIYVKAQFESFTVLEGGYTSFGFAVGDVFEQGKISEYLGLRGGLVWRNGAKNPILGFEGGIDFELGNDWSAGLRSTYDWREDMNLLDSNTAEWRLSGFVKITKRFDL